MNGVIVQGFGLLFDEAKSKTGANAGVTLFFVLEFEDLEDRAGVVVHAASVSVILSHEHFDTTEDCFLRVAKFVGDDALESKGEDVVSFVVVVKGVADAVKEVEGVLELPAGVTGENTLPDKLGHRAGSSLGINDPIEIVVIAEGSWTFLDVGFLKKNGVRPLGVAGVDIEAALFKKTGLVFFNTVLAEAVAEFAKEFLVSDDET